MYFRPRKILRRIVVGTLSLSLLAPLAVCAIDVTINSTWSPNSEQENRILIGRDAAYTTISQEMTVAYDSCVKGLTSGGSVDESTVMLNYGVYLLYMHWITSNAQVHVGADAFQISVVENPEGTDVATAASLIMNAEYLRSTIQSKEFLDSTTSISDGTYNSYDSFSLKFPTYNMLTQDNFIGNGSYGTALDKLIYDYIDGSILVSVAKYFEKTGDGVSREDLITSLSEDFPTEWLDEVNKGNSPDDLVALVTEIKDDIRPYLDIYSSLSARYSDVFSMVLKDETISFEGTSYDVLGYSKEYTMAKDRSYILDTLYRYIYNAGEDDSSEGEYAGVVDNSDLINGVFGILTGGKIENGEVLDKTGAKVDNLELNSVGLRILAAGVVYDPFVSKAGNEDYMDLISQFISTESEGVIGALQTAISIKKPIYVISQAKEGQTLDEIEVAPTGNYSIAHLSDLLTINQNRLNIFACTRGKMVKSEIDASTFDYVQGGVVVETVEVGDTDDADNDETVKTVEVVENSFSTPGTKDMFATGDQLTSPVALATGSSSWILDGRKGGEAIEVGGLTSLILHNASIDAKNSKYIQNASTEMIFLNGLGDIVLSDGTIVLPAVSNPILYTESMETGGGNVVDDARSGVGRVGYYPYNAAFLNHYPSLFTNVEGKAEASESDVGKYVIMQNLVFLQDTEDGDIANATGAARIYKVDANGNASTATVDRVEICSIAGNSFSVTDVDTDHLCLFKYEEASPSGWIADITWDSDVIYYVFNSIPSSEGVTFFPLQVGSADIRESFLKTAAPLVTSAVRYIDGSDDTPGTTFSMHNYVYSFVAEGLQGSVYTDTMIKNYQRSYDELLEDQYGFFTKFVVDIAEDLLNTFGRIDGVLALKNGYENGFFNAITSFVQNYYLLIAVIIVAILAVKFLRGRYSLVYIVFLSLLSFAIFELYAMWMPIAVPNVYNFFVNDIVEDIAWKSVTVSAENYEDTYQDSDRVDSLTGKPQPYTATITLYRMGSAEILQFCDQTGVDIADLQSGDIVYLDQSAGIFAQGDAIKMSIDRLFVNNTMRGLYESQWDIVDSSDAADIAPVDKVLTDNPYVIKLTHPYTSLEAYYTPYSMIQRAFLVNLNNFTNIFMVERNYYSYGDGLYKDAFVFQSYINSGIFVAPGNDEALEANIRVDTVTGQPAATVSDILTLSHAYFDPQEDWLNLRSIFAEPTDELKNSHWGKSLQDAGYYGYDWTMNEEQEVKMSNLISYINTHTKKFVIENQDMLKFCSDENAIKLVSLYATTCFTHKVSAIGSWLYPNYINSADIELKDVLYGAMTSLTDRVVASDGSVVNTVTVNLGLGGAVLVLLITLSSVIFIFILTYLIPVLYALLGVVFIYKLLNEDSSIGVVKGYIKVTLVTTSLYIIYSFGLRLVEIGGYAWYGYLACAILTVACIYFLFYVIFSVVANPLELGNDNIAKNLFRGMNRLTGGRLERVVSHTTNIFNHGHGHNYGRHTARNFFRSSPVDERYATRRSEHYGRWSDFDDQNLGRRAQVIDRFGRINEHADEVGRTRTGFRQTRFMRGFSRTRENVSRAVNSARNYIRNDRSESE